MSYYVFDIERFLRDSKGWSDELKSLQEELDSITEISGASDAPGHSTDISRPVERIAIRRDQIVSRAEHIKVCVDALNAGMSVISEHDRELILGFFFGEKAIYKFIDAWCEKHCSNRQYCYRDRRLALDHLRVRVEGYMKVHGYDA